MKSRTRRRFGVLLTTLALATGAFASGSPAGAADCDAGEFSVSGTVTDATTGLPLTVITSVGFGTFDDQGTVLPASTYATCLPAGSYPVNFFADGYFIEWHDDAPTLGEATPITGLAGDHLTI
ncbi:MAG: hypothetical protein HKN91_12155, partial [Acidimicrobiia bacterium]|nr:hypothetical protein [Acidimicrobiia bacterium]